jgi:hypothetical protein
MKAHSGMNKFHRVSSSFGIKIIFFITYITLFSNLLNGQIIYSANPKVGIYAGSEGKFVYGGEINIASPKKLMYSLGVYKASSMLGTESDPREKNRDIQFLFGTYFDNEYRYTRLQIQFGISYFTGAEGDVWDSMFPVKGEKFSTVGLPVKAGFKAIGDYVSFGFDVQGNLNPEENYVMLLLSLELGKIK